MNDLLTRLTRRLPGFDQAGAEIEALALLLDVSPDELQRVHSDPRFCYRPFTVRKRGGGRRHIVAPSSPLKQLQRRLLRRYLAHQPLHESATAFRSGSSIAAHARRHLGQAIVLTVDLADFFPSTAARRIRAWFRAQGWQDEALETLMRLCVYRGGLPQGAPTSPALSNLVNVPLDEKLSELTTLEGGRYSRYCDDLAFSWPHSAEPSAFRLRVEDHLEHFGYRIQDSKGWRLQRADQRPEITGVLLDGRRLRLPRRIVTRLRRVLTDRRTNATTKAAQLQGYKGLRDMLK